MTPGEIKSKITAAFERYVTGAFYALTGCEQGCFMTSEKGQALVRSLLWK
jgi:hypothetical protein